MTTQLPQWLAAIVLALSVAASTSLATSTAASKAAKTPSSRPKSTESAPFDGQDMLDDRPPNPFDGERSTWLADQFATSRQLPPVSGQTLPYLGPQSEADEAEATDHGEFDHEMQDAVQGCPPGYASSSGAYQWHMMPQGLIYRPYLAGVKESRFRSVWNHDHNDGNIWDITLGGNVSLLRYGTRGDARPAGWEIGMEGAGLVRLDRDEEEDVNAADFRFGVPISWGDSIYQFKVAYYHLSSHVGDEYLLRTPGFNRLNYSRNVLVLGGSAYATDWWRVYGEMGYGFDVDVADPWEFQFGVDWAPPGRTGARGAPFAAVNGHLREEVDFGGNFVVQTGWAWRRSPATGLFRLGVEYYNGKDDQFSFFNDSVEKFGFGIWYDY